MKYLQRLETGRVRAWWVRIGTPKKQGYIQQSFTDKKCGGSEKAFEAAVALIKDESTKRKFVFDEKDYVFPIANELELKAS